MEIGSDYIGLVGEDGFEPSKRRRNRFTVCPHWPLGNSPIFNWSWWTDSNPRPADYKSAALPAELHQHQRGPFRFHGPSPADDRPQKGANQERFIIITICARIVNTFCKILLQILLPNCRRKIRHQRLRPPCRIIRICSMRDGCTLHIFASCGLLRSTLP